MRLIDAKNLMKTIKQHNYLLRSNLLNSTDYGMFTIGIQQAVDEQPTIYPETLPIVRELQERLEQVTAERDAAVRQLSEIEDCDTCKHRSCIPRGGFGRRKWEWNGGEGDHP